MTTLFVNFRRLTLKCLPNYIKGEKLVSRNSVLLIYHENKAKCSVLLFRPTKNKETLEKVGTFATSIILADLAKATGIDFSVGYESEIAS